MEMRRSDFYIKLTSAVLFVAIICYLGVYLYTALKSTYATTRAINYTVEETGVCDGYIIRAETALPEVSGEISPAVPEGEKVALGQQIAMRFTSAEAKARADELRTLELKIEQYEKTEQQGALLALESAQERVVELSKLVADKRIIALEAAELEIMTGVIGTGVEENIEALKQRYNELSATYGDTVSVYSPRSGLFSSLLDGYEEIGPEILENLTPSKLRGFFSEHAQPQSYGKLIYDITWYYAAIIDTASASRLTVGDTAKVILTGILNFEIEMKVDSIGRNDDGEHVVVFSCDRYMKEIAGVRFARAEIILSSVSGICVPRESIRLDDDGTTYLYLETGAYAERINVKILSVFGDNYLVENTNVSGTSLRDGALVIIRGNNIRNGKPVPKR